MESKTKKIKANVTLTLTRKSFGHKYGINLNKIRKFFFDLFLFILTNTYEKDVTFLKNYIYVRYIKELDVGL